jgi:hypothetical protein
MKIGLELQSTGLSKSPRVRLPIYRMIDRLGWDVPLGLEGLKDPRECSWMLSLIASPNSCRDASPGVLEPCTWVRSGYNPLIRKENEYTVLEGSLDPFMTPD